MRLLLPRAPEAAVAAVIAPPSPVHIETDIAAASNRLVLVLDDEPAVRQTLCEHLHQLGYLTLECGDGEEAAASGARGNCSRTVVPWPGAVSSSIWPPDCRTKP